MEHTLAMTLGNKLPPNSVRHVLSTAILFIYYQAVDCIQCYRSSIKFYVYLSPSSLYRGIVIAFTPSDAQTGALFLSTAIDSRLLILLMAC